MPKYIVTRNGGMQIRVSDPVEADTPEQAAQHVSAAEGDVPGTLYSVVPEDGSAPPVEIKVG